MDPHAYKIISMAIPQLNASMIITDTEGKTIYVSQPFTHKTGYTIEDMFGQSPGKILQGSKTEHSAIISIRNGIKHKICTNTTITNYRKNGTIIVFTLNIQPVFDKSILLGFICIQQDITEIIKQSLYTERLTSELIDEIKNKNTLLSILRHDIRDSLSCIKALDMLGELSNQYVLRATDSCLKTVDRCVGKSDHCVPKIVVTDVVKDIDYRANGKKIIIRNNIPDNLVIRINEGYLFIAMRNFIVNSIKFSNMEQEIIIEVKVLGNDYFKEPYLFITDKGIGMSKELVEHLQNSKLPLQKDDDISRTGTRSGFIMCRELLETQGYILKIDSELGKGTVICIGPLRNKNFDGQTRMSSQKQSLEMP